VPLDPTNRGQLGTDEGRHAGKQGTDDWEKGRADNLQVGDVTATGLAKSIMASLVEHEFVAQSEDGSYHPGPRVLRLAGHALTNVDLATAARPVLADLVAQTRCTIEAARKISNVLGYVELGAN
jgi:hypothetical protein